MLGLSRPARRAKTTNPLGPDLGRIGRYELIQLLGVGGMAEVFKARATGPSGFERTVVVKRIHPAYSHDPEFVAMFVAEAKLLGLLHHANVVQAYDFGEADGALFMVLEFVDGPSLGRVMTRLVAGRRTMPPAIAASFALEVCRALDYVHALRDPDGTPLEVIHRDVTPSNIVLTATGALKLLDFGVAKYGTSKVRTNHRTVKGKPAYLAPEALEGRSIDARVDLFSLGVVLYELLTLTNLFAGDDDLVIMRKILDMPIEPPSRLRPDVPPALDAIVLKALARDPAARYANAAEMARDLSELVVASRVTAEQIAAFTRSVAGPSTTAASRRVRTVPFSPLLAGGGTPVTHEVRPVSAMARLRDSRFGRWLLGPRV
jgi:eukaryotic-like serine/threonine-protein kinase